MHKLPRGRCVCCPLDLVKTDEKYPADGIRMIKLSFTLLDEISDAPKTWLPNEIYFWVDCVHFSFNMLSLLRGYRSFVNDNISTSCALSTVFVFLFPCLRIFVWVHCWVRILSLLQIFSKIISYNKIFSGLKLILSEMVITSSSVEDKNREWVDTVL